MPTVTLGDLQQRIWSRLDQNTLLYPSAIVTQKINESIRCVNLLTGLIQTTVTQLSQKNRFWYSIVGTGLIYPTRVQFANTYLEPTSFLQLGRSRPNWPTETSANQLTQPVSWFPYGFRTVGIYPADANGGEVISITGCAEPPVLVNPTDTINLPNSVFAAFDELAVTSLVLKESPKTFAQASTNYQEFLRQIKAITIFRSWIAPRYWISEAQQPVNR